MLLHKSEILIIIKLSEKKRKKKKKEVILFLGLEYGMVWGPYHTAHALVIVML